MEGTKKHILFEKMDETKIHLICQTNYTRDSSVKVATRRLRKNIKSEKGDRRWVKRQLLRMLYLL